MASTAAAVGLTPAVRSRWYSAQDARSGLGRVGTRWPDACWAGELTGCSSGGLGGAAGGAGQLATQGGGQVAGGLAVWAGELTGCSSGGLGGAAGGAGQLAAPGGGEVAGGLAVWAGRAEDQLALIGALGGLDRGDVRIQGVGAVGRIDGA